MHRKGVIFMKIEKISDSQIRCTLTRKDLIDRQLRLSELAYGSEKAKALFRDMMLQASYECGFEADDIPLMIEAIPVSSDCLVLLITKVEDPDELDTRFSNFTPFQDRELESSDSTEENFADEIINCFEHISEFLSKKSSSKEAVVDQLPQTLEAEASEDIAPDVSTTISRELYKVYTFHRLSEILDIAKILTSFYQGENTLFKNPANSLYHLVVRISSHTAEDFNKVCNILSEYGQSEHLNYATLEYYNEHFEPIIKDQALQVLTNL